eukprot:c10536_g1_i1.p1 GENE.c10536_g1_i1~~c10536_g1_i1.p1  ORF type:complete len:898 (+),score=234.67 c10536_g1_i1:377-3070(+)
MIKFPKFRSSTGQTPHLIHLVALAEFDELTGSTLRERYPKDASIGDLTENFLAEFAIPEGGHLHEKDIAYQIIKLDQEILYGMAYFSRRSDPTMKRGMRQAACIVLARAPHYDIFEPFLAEGVAQLLTRTQSTSNTLKALFTAMSESETSHKVTLWGKDHHISMRELNIDEFGQASLSWFVQLFRTDTMIIWYALLRQERVMFSGNTALDVGRCCITAPLLVAPVHGFASSMCPYLPLALLDSLQNKEFHLFGVTNGLVFNNKNDMYDVLALLTSACVDHQQGMKVSGRDKHFIKNVMNGINDMRGEKWVRAQFRVHTEQFLERLTSNRLADQQKKFLGASSDRPFTKTALYSRYLSMHARQSSRNTENQDASQKGVTGLLAEIQGTDKGKQYNLLLKQLDDALTNISDIEELVEAGGVTILTSSLFATDSTERKYTVSILASMAMIIKGQVAILSENLLPRILGMVQNPAERPNVQTAACGCLYKISTLFIGAKALVDHGALDHLTAIVCSEDFNNLTLKVHAANTLLQIYQMLPDMVQTNNPTSTCTASINAVSTSHRGSTSSFTSSSTNLSGASTASTTSTSVTSATNSSKGSVVGRVSGDVLAKQLSSTDPLYNVAVLQLLDLWGVRVVGKIVVPEEVRARVTALSAINPETELPDIETRFNTTASFQTEFIQSPIMVLQFVEAGGITALWQNIQSTKETDPLRHVSWDVLSLTADTYAGASCLLELRIIESAVDSLLELQSTDCLFHVLRFCDVVCQQPTLGSCFIFSNGVQKLVGFVRRNFTKEIRMLCVLALSALRYLLRFQHQHYDLIRTHIAPLQTLTLAQHSDHRSQDLDKMVSALLHFARVTPVSLDSQALIGEFFQTLSRRSKYLSTSLETSRATGSTSLADAAV